MYETFFRCFEWPTIYVDVKSSLRDKFYNDKTQHECITRAHAPILKVRIACQQLDESKLTQHLFERTSNWFCLLVQL